MNGVKPFRVAISGSPGTGKTTLANQIVRAFPKLQVSISADHARVLAERGVRINLDSGLEDYLAFLAYRLEQTRIVDGDLAIFERTLIDVVCFMELNRCSSPWLRKLVDELIRWQLPLFSVYFYIPPEFEPERDGIRITDLIAIHEFDLILKHRLEEYSPGFITISGGRDERLLVAIEKIRSLMPINESDSY